VFAWKWWLLMLSSTGVGILMRKNVVIVLGFWHTYYYGCCTTWKHFKGITAFAFQCLFPTAPWYEAPKLYQIVRFYTYLTVAFGELYDEFEEQIHAHPQHRGIRYLWDFFDIVLPSLHDYALKSQDIKCMEASLVNMQILFEYCNNTTYTPALMMQMLHLKYWKAFPHPIYQMIKHHMEQKKTIHYLLKRLAPSPMYYFLGLI